MPNLHVLLHGASIYRYNGHLRGPATLAPVAEHLAVELSLPVFTTKFRFGWDSNTQLANAQTNCYLFPMVLRMSIFCPALPIAGLWVIFIILVKASLLTITIYMYVFDLTDAQGYRRFLDKLMHFHYMTVNDMPLHNVPCHRVHAIYKFDKSFYAFYNNMGMNTRYMKSVVGCPGVKINTTILQILPPITALPLFAPLPLTEQY